MKRRLYIKVFIVSICILCVILLGIALKLFVIGEPADGAQVYDNILFGDREVWPDKDNTGHNSIILPSPDEIIAVSLEHDGTVTNYDYQEWIGEFISILMDMDITDESSVQDMPNLDDYTKIDIVCNDGTIYTLFYYEKNGVSYVEQPYQGIYAPAPALGYHIESLLGGLTVDYPAMLMVDGHLYSGGGTVLTASLPLEADGQITSTCRGVPINDGQSNFGSGYSYQYGSDDTINVLLDNNEWHVFELVDVERTIDADNLSEQERMELDPTYFPDNE